MEITDTCEESVENIDSFGLGCALEVFNEHEEVQCLIKRLNEVYNDDSAAEATIQRFVCILNQYQEQPHLLDCYLEEFLEQLLSIARNVDNDEKLQNIAFKFLYVITKVRGFKVVLRHLPHEVSDVEQVLSLLSQQNPSDFNTWETRYVLLLWMSIVVMIPFHMARLDDVSIDSNDKKKTVMERIMDKIKLYLSVSDKARDAAAFLASRFITRPDVKSLYLAEYLDWALKMLVNSDSSDLSGLNLQAGILSSLALLFKHGKRDDVKEYGATILNKILECGFKNSKSTTVRKMALKLIQRIGLSFLQVKVATWLYNRGTRILADNLALSCNLPVQLEEHNGAAVDDEYDIPDETEDVIEQLLVGLRDKDTVIRWSAAKGIGRVTGRLPKELADDVVTSVLELFSLRESDSAWHGGCLALAELGRRGLILPQHLGKVVCVVLKALVYDELRGNFSVGAHIRDAACYVCWSFARAYEPDILQPYVTDIAGALLITSVFDREINCRRAASAAFQENVGRQGTFPHGIDIITTADYYAVGSRQNAFLNLSVHIAQFPEYTLPLINHLLDHKVNHWDPAIRKLTAKALHNLTQNDPIYMSNKALPFLLSHAIGIDLNARHGSILSIAEIIHALYIFARKEGKKTQEIIDNSTLEAVRDIVFILNERKLFRGLGGVFMRTAMCVLIEKVSLANVPFSHDEKLTGEWKSILDSCLQHMDVIVRQAAVSALPHFCFQFYPPNQSQHLRLLEDFILQLEANQLESRCGFALAIGALPDYILKGQVEAVLLALARCCVVTTHSNWAEARRDAIKALHQVTVSIGIDPSGSSSEVINIANMDILYESFFNGIEDYTKDSRGEIGAIVREASMQAIQDVTLLFAKKHSEMLSEKLVHKIFCSVLQQCLEKIDRTRSVAGSVFAALLHSTPEIPHISHCEELRDVFPKDLCQQIDWSSPADTFHHFSKLLKLKTYTYSLLSGFAVSVGGLTEFLVKYSRSALVNFLLSAQSDACILNSICLTLILILKNNLQNDRIIIPFFKMMDHLLASGIVFPDCDESGSFPLEMLDFVWKTSFRSSDPQKLLAAVDLLCDLLQFCCKCQKETLSRLAIFLCHRFPRVRKFTAGKLYEAFLSYDVIPDCATEEVFAILSETDWDKSVEVLRPIRNNLCLLLGILPPRLKPK